MGHFLLKKFGVSVHNAYLCIVKRLIDCLG